MKPHCSPPPAASSAAGASPARTAAPGRLVDDRSGAPLSKVHSACPVCLSRATRFPLARDTSKVRSRLQHHQGRGEEGHERSLSNRRAEHRRKPPVVGRCKAPPPPAAARTCVPASPGASPGRPPPAAGRLGGRQGRSQAGPAAKRVLRRAGRAREGGSCGRAHDVLQTEQTVGQCAARLQRGSRLSLLPAAAAATNLPAGHKFKLGEPPGVFLRSIREPSALHSFWGGPCEACDTPLQLSAQVCAHSALLPSPRHAPHHTTGLGSPPAQP